MRTRPSTEDVIDADLNVAISRGLRDEKDYEQLGGNKNSIAVRHTPSSLVYKITWAQRDEHKEIKERTKRN